ncbi:MAG: MMPL family transporter [Gammaproteobacteria bacterium]|nr:MMPL family transporter [Gammaproteobacteria bacterium]NNJ96189.1 MMPL family transporter [Gammaproteobacteria bacterium]
MVELYTHFIIRWRYVVLLLTIAFVLIAGYGAQRLSFSNDYRMFFGPDNPQLLAFEKMQNTFNKNDNIMFVVTPSDGKVFSVETLKAIKDITEEAWQIPFSTRVDSVTNHQHTSAVGDDLIVDDLVPDPTILTRKDLARIQFIAINEPMMVSRLISPDSKYTGINVTVQLPGERLDEVPTAVAYARDMRDRYMGKYPELDIRLVGLTMMNNAFPEASQGDAQNLYPIALGFIIVALLLMLKGVSGTLTTFLMIVFSIITAMGLAGWLGIRLSPPVMSAPIMVMTMAIADAVHLLVTMKHEMHLGKNKVDAMVESMRINFWPIFVTSLTTVLGFLSLNFSDAPPFHDLGNIAAMGVAAAFVFSITFLPALITLLPARSRREVTGKYAMERFGDFVVSNYKSLFIGSSIVVLMLVTLVPKNELNDIFVEYFDTAIQFREDSDYTAEHLTGVYYIDFSLGMGESGGISDPAFLKNADKFVRYLRAQPEVMHVFSLTDTFKRLNKNMHGDDPAWYKLPDDRNLAAQYLLLYEMSLPYGLDLNNQIDVGKTATKIAVTLKTLSSNEILAFEQRTSAWLQENMPELTGFGTGPTVMFAHLGKRNINSMLIGTTIALFMISMVLIIFFRSFKYGLISLLPNLLPAAAAFGIWGLFVGQVGIALSVVTGMTLGIVVDDTVHFMSKYLRARREKGFDAKQAVHYAFNSVGIALLVTSIVLVAGFMIMAQSHFELNAGMGLLTSVVITLALAIDFMLLPPLLIKLEENGKIRA